VYSTIQLFGGLQLSDAIMTWLRLTKDPDFQTRWQLLFRGATQSDVEDRGFGSSSDRPPEKLVESVRRKTLKFHAVLPLIKIDLSSDSTQLTAYTERLLWRQSKFMTVRSSHLCRNEYSILSCFSDHRWRGARRLCHSFSPTSNRPAPFRLANR